MARLFYVILTLYINPACLRTMPNATVLFERLIANVDALNRRGVLQLKHSEDLVVWPPGFIGVWETAHYFTPSR